MENKDDLIRLFASIGEKHGFMAHMIEKDFYLTKILHKISEKQLKNLVFKGGTCLNKCYLNFYRLSEDLDFVYNYDIHEMSKKQVKHILDELRREFFSVLESIGLKTNKELGKGWKMLTSKGQPKILGLEINATYNSLIDDSLQNIKIEVSFRKELRMPSKRIRIKHKFIDALGNPVLREDIEIEAIDLIENFAEKFRSLVTRKRIAARDIYDIYFILKNEILAINREVIDLILVKINESMKLSEKELIEFMKSLDSLDIDKKEIESVIKTDENLDIKEMLRLIIRQFEVKK